MSGDSGRLAADLCGKVIWTGSNHFLLNKVLKLAIERAPAPHPPRPGAGLRKDAAELRKQPLPLSAIKGAKASLVEDVL